MNLEFAVAAAMFAGVVAYAVLGGADFGSGFYDATAGGTAQGARVRTLVDHSIGPVWEANHVWLIYVLVMWWTGFPTTFAAAMTSVAVPVLLALLGIVLRGSSFAFRKYTGSLAQARAYGVIFAASSVLTPFFLGASVGAIVSGRVPAEGGSDLFASWLTVSSLVGGTVAVGTCAFLAGCFLTADARRVGDERLADTMRRRTLAVSVVTGLVVFAGLLPLRSDAPTFFAGLSGRGLPLMVLSAGAGIATMMLLYRRHYGTARFTAVAAVGAVVLGWGVAQYPWLLVDEVLIAEAAGAPATLRGLLVAVGLAVVIVVPALAYLLRLTQSARWADLRSGQPTRVNR